jgi:iron donor protein CyaY
MLTDSEFKAAVELALDTLNRAMDTVADEHDVEILYQSGVLSIEIEDPAPSKIVISPNSSAGQIWISAQWTSFKLDWSEPLESFVYRPTGETIQTLVGRLTGEELGISPLTF